MARSFYMCSYTGSWHSANRLQRQQTPVREGVRSDNRPRHRRDYAREVIAHDPAEEDEVTRNFADMNIQQYSS